MACIAHVSGKSSFWTPSPPSPAEAINENRGIGTEWPWVLVLPCFLLVSGKSLFLSEPLFLHLYNGGNSPAACPELKERPKRCNSSKSWGRGQGTGEGAWHRCTQSPSGSLDRGSPVGMRDPAFGGQTR